MIKANRDNCFTILLLNKTCEEDEEEKWTFSYNYYNFNCIENGEQIIINVFNNFNKLVKTFSNVILQA
jgi:hypothetical protein